MEQRSSLEMAMFAAWVNVPADQVPASFLAPTCPSTMAAWRRVGEAALAWHQSQQQDPFAAAVALDPESLIAVIDLARQIWEGEELAAWLTTPSAKFDGQSPLERCAVDYGGHKGTGADDVLDFLETLEVR